MLNSIHDLSEVHSKLIKGIIYNDLEDINDAIHDCICLDTGDLLLQTSIFLAFEMENCEAMELLFKNDVSPNTQDKDGWTMLMYAAVANEIKLGTTLLKHGAHVDLQNAEGKTALMLAINNDNDEMVRLLLKHKPNLDLTDTNSITALEYATRNTKSSHFLQLTEFNIKLI